MSESDKGNVIVDIETITTTFIDYIEIDISLDTVYLNTIQKLPGKDSKAKLISRYAISWPHFARLSKSFNSLLLKYRDDIKDYCDKNLYEE